MGDNGVVMKAADALSKLGESASAAQGYIKCLDQGVQSVQPLGKDQGVRLKAVQALGKIGAQGVPGLAKALQDSDAQVRYDAINALGACGAQAASATAVLEKVIEDDNDVNGAAKEALQAIQTAMQAPQMTYAAPQVQYVEQPQYTYAAPAEAVSTMTYGAPQMTYAQPISTMTYAAEPVGQPMSTMTYGAPVTYAAAPMGNQPVYTISPERFQLIMQGQPLTPEEIAAMTGAAAAPSMSTMVPGAGVGMPIAAVSTAFEPTPSAVVTEPVAPAAVASTSSKKDSSKKKSSKKKLSSKKKEKGCC